MQENYPFFIMKRSAFEDRFFNEFIFSTHNRSDILFEDSGNDEWIYFIKSGEVQISTNKSMLELNHIIQLIGNITNNNDILKNGYNLRNGKL